MEQQFRLLLPDQAAGGPGKLHREIADALGCGQATIGRSRQQFVEEGIEAALNPKPTMQVNEMRLEVKAELHPVAIAGETRRRAEHIGP